MKDNRSKEEQLEVDKATITMIDDVIRPMSMMSLSPENYMEGRSGFKSELTPGVKIKAVVAKRNAARESKNKATTLPKVFREGVKTSFVAEEKKLGNKINMSVDEKKSQSLPAWMVKIEKQQKQLGMMSLDNLVSF